MRRKSEAEKVARPGRSTGWASWAATLTRRRSVSQIATRPIGMLTKKIHSQPRVWVMMPPDQRPDCHGAADRRPPDSEGGGAVLAVELLPDQRQRGREHPRAADSLQPPGEIEEGRVVGDPAEQRGEGEDPEPDREDAAPAEAVAERARRQQKGGEGQRVGVDDPLQAGEAGPEVALDIRQGDVDDRDVEQQHERRQRNQDQRPPLSFQDRASVPGVGDPQL